MVHATNDGLVADTQAEVLDARPSSRFMWPVEILSAGLLTVIIALLLGGVFMRYVLATPLFWADEVISIAFLWLAMLGSAIAIDRNEHLRLTVFVSVLPQRFKGLVDALAGRRQLLMQQRVELP